MAFREQKRLLRVQKYNPIIKISRKKGEDTQNFVAKNEKYKT